MSKTRQMAAMKSKVEYMKNCVWWIQNYIDNDIADNRVIETLNNLDKHIRDIRNEFPPHPQPSEADQSGRG